MLGAWLAKESVRDIYLTDQPDAAATRVDKAIVGCLDDDDEEIRALGAPSDGGGPRSWRITTPAPPTDPPKDRTCW